MTHPLTTATPLPAPRMDNQQERLDAAIALFRSEASASGYVVEEVRLRLPVPDVDVMPRVVIAQQNASTGAPPIFPRAKHHRPSSPHTAAAAAEHNLFNGRESRFRNGKPNSYRQPNKGSPDSNETSRGQGKGTGVKRTVSGSVIFHSIPARTAPAPRENFQKGLGSSHTRNKMGPLSSIPYLPTKDGHQPSRASGHQKGQFWKTVIGGEKGRQILQAAENMQRLCHASHHQTESFRNLKAESETVKKVPHVSKNAVELKGAAETEDSEQTEAQGPSRKNPSGESTHHINGYEIPESDVQLLLSSAADNCTRECIPVSKPTDIQTRKSPTLEKKQIVVRPPLVEHKSDGLRSTPAPSTKNLSRSRSSERKSGSCAARPYKCTKCPSSFDREGHLRVHILAVHEKKRPFVCQVCDASFGHSSSLLRHVRTVHQASPQVGSGRAPNIARSTPNNNDTGRGKLEVLSGEEQEDSEKHFRCSACRMAFNRVALLNRHVAEKHPLQTSLSESMSKNDKSS